MVYYVYYNYSKALEVSTIKKDFLKLFLFLIFLLMALTSCAKSPQNTLSIGVVVPPAFVGDTSLSDSLLDSLNKSEDRLGYILTELVAAEDDHNEYMSTITELYNTGCRVIFAPSPTLSTAVVSAQDKYPDCTFICIDFIPQPLGENTSCLQYSEKEAGFLAGFATAIELKDGELGGIFSLAIPPVQRYNWGFQQGVAYANDNFDTTLSMKAENFTYLGKFDEPSLGKKLAAKMYDRGVRCIFLAASLSSNGALAEAAERRSLGQDIWAVGSDFDQFPYAIYSEDDQSAVLTSGTKNINKSVLNTIETLLDGSFPLGTTLTYSVANDSICLPSENPNLSRSTEKAVRKVLSKIKSGDIIISSTPEGLLP